MTTFARAAALRFGMWQGVVLCGFLTLLVWLPSLQNGFLWDDGHLILRNRVLHDASFLETLRQPFWAVSEHLPVGSLDYYRPVVRGAYWLEWQSFGDRPRGYHVINLILHIACSVMVTVWMGRRLQKAGFVQVTGPALLAGLLFALHPSRVENVGWISGSTDLWMMLFLLSGLLLWDSQKIGRAALSSVLIALALFAKETAVVTIVLLVTDALLLRRADGEAEPWTKRARGFGVLLAVFAAALILRFVLGPVPGRTLSLSWGLFGRVCASAGEYLSRVFMPWPISFIEGISGNVRVFEGPVLALGAVGLLASMALFVLALLRPALRPWLADLLWFWLPLGPVLNVIPMQMSALTANRFLYFPLIGLGALLARAWVQLSPRWQRGSFAAGAVVLLFCGVSVASAQKYLVSDLSLWTREVDLHPDDLRAVENLARVLMREQRTKQAADLVERSMAMAKSDDARARMMLLWAYCQLALTPDRDQTQLIQLREFFDALERSDPSATLVLAGGPLSIRLWPTLTDDLKRRSDVGNFPASRGYAHLRTGSYDKAVESFRQGITRDSRLPYAWRTWIRVLGIGDHWDEALSALKEVKQRFPQEPWIAQYESLVDRGAKAAAVQPPTVESTLVHAQVVMAFNGPLRAQALLSEWDPLKDPRIFKAQVGLYFTRQRLDLAKTLLQAGERQWPDQKEYVQKVSEEIARKEK